MTTATPITSTLDDELELLLNQIDQETVDLDVFDDEDDLVPFDEDDDYDDFDEFDDDYYDREYAWEDESDWDIDEEDDEV